jgi:uncharacterized protein (DUF983 family)
MQYDNVLPCEKTMSTSARFFLLVMRALRLRCPFCGRGKLFRGIFSMHSKCESCGASFEREPGFFLGSIYFNYGLTALLATITYSILLFGYGLPENALLAGALVFVVLFPLWFFRYARSLWLGFDQFADPREQYQNKDADSVPH